MRIVLNISLVVALCVLPFVVSTPTAGSAAGKGGFNYYVEGDPSDVVTATTGLLAIQGGGTVDAVFHRMAARAGGGDFVVLDAFGDGSEGTYIWQQNIGVNSVETIVLNTRAAAADPFVVRTVRNAEAIWIAGGDQSNYIDHWKDTPLEDAINEVAAKPAPIGGNSAGAAVMGEFVYSAESASSLTSSEGLSNPYHRDLTLARDFLLLRHMEGVLVDQHVEERDRIGRTVALLARLVVDGWAAPAAGKAAAIDRETVVLVEPNGTATVLANAGHKTPFVWFMSTPGLPEVCQPKTPLTFRNLPVYRLGPGAGSFNLNTWTGAGGLAYTLSAEAGVLVSSRGEIY